MPTGWTLVAASSTLEEWTRAFSRGQQCSCVMEVSQGSGVCAWSCCHLANGNKTYTRLFTHVISFFLNFNVCGQAKFRKKKQSYDAWISGVSRPKFTKPGTCVEQPSVLNKFFFSELQYSVSVAFGRESRKFAGGV